MLLKSSGNTWLLGLFALQLMACGGSGSGGGGDGGSEKSNNAPTIVGSVSNAEEDKAFLFTPVVADEDNDPLQVTVSSLPGWLSYNSSSYSISGTPSTADLGQSQEITYSVSDGKESSQLQFRIQVDYNNLKQALRTGDHSYVNNPNEYIDSANNAVSSATVAAQALKIELFNLAANGQAKGDSSSLADVSWNPTHDAAHLATTFGLNHVLLESNATSTDGYDVYKRNLAIMGEQAGDNRNARFLAFGGNPMRNSYRDETSVNADMHQLLENGLGWLAGRRDFSSSPLRVVMAQMSQGYYFPDQVANRAWLDARYAPQVSYNDAGSCDAANLASCLSSDVDVLVISQVSANEAENPAIVAAVKAWLAAGGSVMYVHNDGGLTSLGRSLLQLLDVGYKADNYWWRLSVDGYDASQSPAAVSANIEAIAALLTRFKDQSFTIDLSACADKSCPPESGFDDQFQAAADQVLDLFKTLDEDKFRLFDDAAYTFQKSVLLLADHYRQQVRYPMDKTDTPMMAFLKSYFADHAIYNLRDINPAQADLGNFSRSDFSHVAATTKQLSLTSKRYFRPAGVYALPGQTVTVTRTDTAAVNTTVFINTQRSGATHQFNDDAYTRPKYLRTSAISIEPGETLRFTSSHGGPVQIGFDVNDQTVSFRFENIGEHPYWNDVADNARFDAALTAGDYDWAEVATSGFVVHSTLEKMRQSISDPRWGNAAGLAAATKRYMSNFPHVLAGFQGPGIDVVPEIHDFASARSWQIDTIDLVKHMNADQATCGYGCSGNPYDAYWSYGPVDHGDLHELGHGLEVGRFRFAGWEGHASTNPYSYYSKSQYYKDSSGEPDCQLLPFASLKQTLMDSRSSADPFAYMQNADLTSWSQGVAIYIQMMMSAQDQGVLEDGWHLLARLHVLYREFRRADDSDESWAAKRDGLGFSQFTRQEAGALNNNDWLSIALSTVLGRDVRNFLNMWGLDVGATAAAQIASFSYPALPMKYFDSTANGYCKDMSPASIGIH